MSDVQAGEAQTKKSWFARHKIITGAIGLFLFFMIIGMFQMDKVPQAPITQSTSSADVSKETSPAKVAKIGDTVEDKDIAFTVTKVTTAKTLGSSYSKKNAQGTFYVVAIKIANNSNETSTIDSSQFQVIDNQKRTFDRSSEGQIASGFDLFLQQIQPGLSVNANIVFDLPDDAKELQLVVKGSYFSTGAKIYLEK